jgi:hypothetical protein
VKGALLPMDEMFEKGVGFRIKGKSVFGKDTSAQGE